MVKFQTTTRNPRVVLTTYFERAISRQSVASFSDATDAAEDLTCEYQRLRAASALGEASVDE